MTTKLYNTRQVAQQITSTSLSPEDVLYWRKRGKIHGIHFPHKKYKWVLTEKEIKKLDAFLKLRELVYKKGD